MKKKYFGTDGIRGAINSKNINGDMFFKFGLASGTYFKSQKKKKQTAVIAKDTRLSGYTLEPALLDTEFPIIRVNADTYMVIGIDLKQRLRVM